MHVFVSAKRLRVMTITTNIKRILRGNEQRKATWTDHFFTTRWLLVVKDIYASH